MWTMILFGEEFYYIFYIFLIYGFFGWIYESSLVSIKKKSMINRGFLKGPIIPIYGCGALFIYLAFWEIRDHRCLVFLGGACLATLLEYVTSLIMELIFHTRWWDYSNYPFNLGGRVSLLVSLFWGLLSVLMMGLFQPGVNKIIETIPRSAGEMIGFLIFPLFIADIVYAVINSIKFDRILGKISKLRQDIFDYVVETKLYETGEEIVERLSDLRLIGILIEIKMSLEKKIHNSKTNKHKSDSKPLNPEDDKKLKEFWHRYQSMKMHKEHIRFLRAFPSMKVGKRQAALSDLREKMTRKGVRELSKDLKEEVTGRIKSYLSGFLRVTIVGLLVLIQFILIIYLSYKLRGYTVYIYSFIQVLSIIIIIGLINDNRNTSYKVSWICIIAAFPITGHIMFMLWGNHRRKKIDNLLLSRLKRGTEFLTFDPDIMKSYREKYPTKSRLASYLEGNHFPLFKNNQITYYSMGEDIFKAIFEDIQNAKKFILIDFYIVGEGVLWDRLHELLYRKIKEGVKVKFLYDDFGAMLRTPKNFKRTLESEGFEIRVFNPIHKYTDKLYLNYRSHQKIIVVDGNIGYTGGMNLADEYVNIVNRFGKWKDNGIRLVGDAVWGLTVTFLQMWEACEGCGTVDYDEFRPTETFEENDVYCQVISDGPANNPRNPVENTYKQMMYYAKKVLYITTPYLIIEDDMRNALITAAKSGVDVRIITPYIPDKKNVKILTNYNYGPLLAAGVRIFEYTPGFIHAKTILTEDLAIVGTINMDYRSFHLQYECGVLISNNEVVDVIRQDILDTIELCKEVTYEEWKVRPLYIKLYQLVLNLFSTLM